MRTLNHVFAACSKRFGGAFVDLHIESARRGFARYARSVRNKTGAAAPLLAGSSKKQTTPLLRLASRRSSARRWPDDFRRPAPVPGRSMTGGARPPNLKPSASPCRGGGAASVARARPRRHLRHFPRHGWHPAPSEITHNMPATPPQRPRTGALTRGRRATNWTRFVVGRTQILTSRAGVVLRAAGSGDGVARLLARGHGSGGGGIGDGVDADLVRKRCSVGRVSRASRPAAGSGFVRRPRRRRRAWLGSQLRGRRSSPQIDALQRALVAYVSCGVSQAFEQPFRAACSRRRRRAPQRYELV